MLCSHLGNAYSILSVIQSIKKNGDINWEILLRMGVEDQILVFINPLSIIPSHLLYITNIDKVDQLEI